MKARTADAARIAVFLTVFMGVALPVSGQIDSTRAQGWFREAAVLCEREGGRLWGVSLCGPMVFADPVSGSIATNQPAPAAERPRSLGYANSAVDWGGVHWATYVWQGIPGDDAKLRGRLIMHELFHRVQADLGLMTTSGQNDHLDTLEGRYWLRLEWRALAAALSLEGSARTEAMRDALAFRSSRHTAFPGSGENERRDEVREGLAQYTGTVTATSSHEEAVANTVKQLTDAETQPTFVRTFAYPSGAAYGVLLDELSPGWTRAVDGETDLGRLLMAAAGIEATVDATAAAERYQGSTLRAAEEERDTQQQARVEELRQRFVDGPVLKFRRGRQAAFVTTGATPIPGQGTVFFTYRTTSEWGSFETETGVLIHDDGESLSAPGPITVDGANVTGDGWTIVLAPGWVVRPGPRAGDYQVVRQD